MQPGGSAPRDALPGPSSGACAASPSSERAAAAGRVSAAAVSTLRVRGDFLRAARARRHGAAGFLLQARRRDPDESAETPIRVGFTCSRKIGNAVVRNRAKRRLRAVARATLPDLGRPGWDYVLVGRPGATVERPFADLLDDLADSLGRIHRERVAR